MIWSGVPPALPRCHVVFRFFLPEHPGNKVAQQLDHYEGLHLNPAKLCGLREPQS